jgi:hypothetical protein
VHARIGWACVLRRVLCACRRASVACVHVYVSVLHACVHACVCSWVHVYVSVLHACMRACVRASVACVHVYVWVLHACGRCGHVCVHVWCVCIHHSGSCVRAIKTAGSAYHHKATLSAVVRMRGLPTRGLTTSNPHQPLIYYHFYLSYTHWRVGPTVMCASERGLFDWWIDCVVWSP